MFLTGGRVAGLVPSQGYTWLGYVYTFLYLKVRKITFFTRSYSEH